MRLRDEKWASLEPVQGRERKLTTSFVDHWFGGYQDLQIWRKGRVICDVSSLTGMLFCGTVIRQAHSLGAAKGKKVPYVLCMYVHMCIHPHCVYEVRGMYFCLLPRGFYARILFLNIPPPRLAFRSLDCDIPAGFTRGTIQMPFCFHFICLGVGQVNLT
jgi:hypothetical protein